MENSLLIYARPANRGAGMEGSLAVSSPIGVEPEHVEVSTLVPFRGEYYNRGGHTPCEFCPAEFVVVTHRVHHKDNIQMSILFARHFLIC